MLWWAAMDHMRKWLCGQRLWEDSLACSEVVFSKILCIWAAQVGSFCWSSVMPSVWPTRSQIRKETSSVSLTNTVYVFKSPLASCFLESYYLLGTLCSGYWMKFHSHLPPPINTFLLINLWNLCSCSKTEKENCYCSVRFPEVLSKQQALVLLFLFHWWKYCIWIISISLTHMSLGSYWFHCCVIWFYHLSVSSFS